MKSQWQKQCIRWLLVSVVATWSASQLSAQPAAGSGDQVNGPSGDIYSTESSAEALRGKGLEIEYADLFAWQQKFSGLVHVTYQIRVGAFKLHTSSGLALLVKSTAPRASPAGRRSDGDDRGMQAPGGMGYGGGSSEPPQLGLVLLCSASIFNAEIEPDVAKMRSSLNDKIVTHHIAVGDLYPPHQNSENSTSLLVDRTGFSSLTNENGLCLLTLEGTPTRALRAEPIDLNIGKLQSIPKYALYDCSGSSPVPEVIESLGVGKPGQIALSDDGFVGMMLEGKGQAFLAQKRALLMGYAGLLKLQALPTDPFSNEPVQQSLFGNPFGSTQMESSGSTNPFDDSSLQSRSNNNPFDDRSEDMFGDSDPFGSGTAQAQPDPFAADPAASIGHDPFAPAPRTPESQQNPLQAASPEALVRALTLFKQASDTEAREAAKQQIATFLEHQFDAQRSIRRSQIAQLKTRLDQLEASERDKQKQRDEILAARLKQLVE